jgi:putative glutathione S-transferase
MKETAMTAEPTRVLTPPATSPSGPADHIKRHYYQVHRSINPTGIVPVGPDLAGWLTPHGREELGGRPFGTGTPPGPPSPAETVPPGHTPLAAQTAPVS